MKNFILMMSVLLSLTSCSKTKTYTTEEFPLRQLVQKQVTTSSFSGSYFLFVGSISSGTTTVNRVKVFADVDGYYKYINIPLRDLRINFVDDSIKPNIQVRFSHNKSMSNFAKNDVEYVTNTSAWIRDRVWILNCPEIYLPERLLNIDITQDPD